MRIDKSRNLLVNALRIETEAAIIGEAGPREAERVHRDRRVTVPCPDGGDVRLHRDRERSLRQHRVFVSVALLAEELHARHADHAGGDAVGG
ncbi:hypothetical protein FOPE_04514 [Fonsecaea pedrosoi]|nr:hypothetical protein FOPE_04514 [Fonsecaea pedrosoi]